MIDTMLTLPSIRRYAKMKVDIPDEFLYAVVQFLELPNANIGDYICVPLSWIRTRSAMDRKSKVAYPDEPSLINKMRIIKGDKPSEKWKLYTAIIKFEIHSYETANEFIIETLRNASTKKYSVIMSTDCKTVRATARKQYSQLPKTTKLPGLQLKKNANKVKVADKARFDDTIPNLSKSSEYPIVETRPLTLSELQNRVSHENIVVQETHVRENQEQVPHDDPLLTYLNLQRVLDKDIETQTPGKTLYASRKPLIYISQFCKDSQEPQENLLSNHLNRLHDIALTQRVQNKGIPNLRNFLLDFPKPLIWNQDIRSNTSSVIQNPTNQGNQSCQLEVPKSPVNPDHLEVLPIQTAPGQSSEVESVIPKSSYHSKMKSASYSSVGYSNSVELQGSTIEEMAVDELSEARCIQQNCFSERNAESESSANPNSLKNANHSGQSVESSVEEESPVVNEVTSSDVSSMQDVDNDEQMNSSETNSEKMFNFSPKSNEEVNQSVDSILSTKDQVLNFFKKMEVDLSQSCQIAHNLHNLLVQSHEVIKRIANASKNFRELKKGNDTIGTSKEITVEVQQMSEEGQAKRDEEEIPDVNMEEQMKENNDVDSKRNENDDDNFDNDEVFEDVKKRIGNKKVPKMIRSNIRTFVLPPEYDPNDTRWTLKYRENDPELNLVELVPQSNVFIDSLKLAHCKRVSKDGKALARMLLVEIFSQNALSVCSLTGVRATAFDVSGTNVRPGLDGNARMAILTFVEEYALKQTSGAFDTYAVINSLRSKIQEIRVKCDKEREAVP